MNVLTVGPKGGIQIYPSISAVSRALSGSGTTSLNRSISRRLQKGGGYVGKVWVEATNFPGSRR